MSITQLLQHVGDENIEFQNILHSSPTINHGKKDSTILFHTARDKANAIMLDALSMAGTHVGLVVWLPKDKMP